MIARVFAPYESSIGVIWPVDYDDYARRVGSQHGSHLDNFFDHYGERSHQPLHL